MELSELLQGMYTAINKIPVFFGLRDPERPEVKEFRDDIRYPWESENLRYIPKDTAHEIAELFCKNAGSGFERPEHISAIEQMLLKTPDIPKGWRWGGIPVAEGDYPSVITPDGCHEVLVPLVVLDNTKAYNFVGRGIAYRMVRSEEQGHHLSLVGVLYHHNKEGSVDSVNPVIAIPGTWR